MHLNLNQAALQMAYTSLNADDEIRTRAFPLDRRAF